MQHLPQDEVARRAVRSQICSVCCDRPRGSESFGPAVARVCEATCAIFASLPTLQSMVTANDPALDSVEPALRNNVCNTCTLSESAGDYCGKSLARTCPLSCHALDVVALLERLHMTVNRKETSCQPDD
jgi:hypothetical protein